MPLVVGIGILSVGTEWLFYFTKQSYKSRFKSCSTVNGYLNVIGNDLKLESWLECLRQNTQSVRLLHHQEYNICSYMCKRRTSKKAKLLCCLSRMLVKKIIRLLIYKRRH